MAHNITAKSLSGLMKWNKKEPWSTVFNDMIYDLLEPVWEAYGIDDFEDLGSVLDDIESTNLWGCLFELFLSIETEFGNVVDDYIKRRGWKEGARNKAYMKAIRASALGLYKVSDVKPGKSFKATDLIGNGDAITILEMSATRMMQEGDHLAMRPVVIGNATYVAGGMLLIHRSLSDQLVEEIAEVKKQFPAVLETLKQQQEGDLSASDADLYKTMSQISNCQIIIVGWLDSILENNLLPDLEKLTNKDGDKIAAVTLHYQLNPGVSQKVVRNKLMELAEIQHLRATHLQWRIAKQDAKTPEIASHDGWQFESIFPDGSLIMAEIYFSKRRLRIDVNSSERAELAKDFLQTYLAELTSGPVIEHVSFEQLVKNELEEASLQEDLLDFSSMRARA